MPVESLSGGEKLQEYLDKLAKKVSKAASLNVGFLAGSEANGKSAPMIAAIQEYGAPAKGIPPRPFFRNMVKKNKGSWGKTLGDALILHKYDAAVALDAVGEVMDGELRESMIDITEPALSPVTLLLRERFGNNPQEITFADVMKARHDIAKGVVPDVTGTQAKPLIWTGQLLNSINHEVKE